MSSFVCKLRYGGCAWADFGLAGCLLTGFPPRVQLPPLCRVETTSGWLPLNK